MFQYHGASTGRWAGRGVQLHNLPRPTLSQENIDWAFDQLEQDATSVRDLFELTFESTMNLISDCIRGFLIPSEGKQFATVDFSAIEARVLAWLAGEEQVLDVFRTGEDIYKFEAANIYSKPYDEITKDQRQIGKVAVLALGYQGGKGAFQVMAKGYGVKVTDAQADQIKNAWREKRVKTVRYWKQIEDAAQSAVLSPGTKTEAGPEGRKIRFLMKGSFLWCLLPSSRTLCYPYPKIELVETPWGDMKQGITYMSEDATTKKWERQKAYGGLLVENITQAVSRDILAESMLLLDSSNFDIVMHVHDEIVCEVSEDRLQYMEDVMTVVPSWAEGLPIAVEGWRGRRYRK
jgi:DNA polymerase